MEEEVVVVGPQHWQIRTSDARRHHRRHRNNQQSHLEEGEAHRHRQRRRTRSRILEWEEEGEVGQPHRSQVVEEEACHRTPEEGEDVRRCRSHTYGPQRAYPEEEVAADTYQGQTREEADDEAVEEEERIHGEDDEARHSPSAAHILPAVAAVSSCSGNVAVAPAYLTCAPAAGNHKSCAH